jgi:hypothetical protein
MSRIAPAIVGSCCVALALGACATANTPQQNLAYDRWARCSSAYVQVERVDLDGRITFLFSNDADREQALQCLAGASQTGPPLPAPVTVRPTGGP